jgi:putative Ca2+/H+ antiporter (TMEM165/GDT1 family)
MRGFGASLRALERELTAPVIAAIVVAAIALPVLACLGVWAPWALRDSYLQLAGGHAYLELAVLARWLASWD